MRGEGERVLLKMCPHRLNFIFAVDWVSLIQFRMREEQRCKLVGQFHIFKSFYREHNAVYSKGSRKNKNSKGLSYTCHMPPWIHR